MLRTTFLLVGLFLVLFITDSQSKPNVVPDAVRDVDGVNIEESVRKAESPDVVSELKRVIKAFRSSNEIEKDSIENEDSSRSFEYRCMDGAEERMKKSLKSHDAEKKRSSMADDSIEDYSDLIKSEKPGKTRSSSYLNHPGRQSSLNRADRPCFSHTAYESESGDSSTDEILSPNILSNVMDPLEVAFSRRSESSSNQDLLRKFKIMKGLWTELLHITIRHLIDYLRHRYLEHSRDSGLTRHSYQDHMNVMPELMKLIRSQDSSRGGLINQVRKGENEMTN